MANAVAQRVDELQRAEAARVRAEQTEAKRVRAERLRQRAENDVRMAEERDRNVRGLAAAEVERLAIVATLTRGRLTVTVRLSDADVVVRQTAMRSLGTVVNRLTRWAEAAQGAARARALGATVNAASAEEIAAFLADEVRESMKHGALTITVAPESKRKRK